MACLVRVPTEVVKSRAQTSNHGQSSRASFNAARYILTNDGLSGFYRGFGSTIMREVSSFLKNALLSARSFNGCSVMDSDDDLVLPRSPDTIYVSPVPSV